MSTRKIFKDFEVYSRALIGSKDVDPTYPMIKEIIDYFEFEPEWFVFMYVAFYSLDSAIIVCTSMPTKEDWDADTFTQLRGVVTKFGHERRGTSRNTQKQIVMLTEVVKFIDSINAARIGGNQSPMIDSNEDFRAAIEELPLHGGWASFKIAEIFEKSLGYKQFAIPDLGLKGRDPNSNDGPVSGLRWLYGRDRKYTKDMFVHWNRFGANLAKAWGVDIGEVETCLCKFHKFMTGKYFVGHDIQEFVELEDTIGSEIYAGMMGKHFDPIFWKGKKKLEKPKKKTYKDTGEILYDEFADEFEKINVIEILIKTK